jgi:hypothetical protein
VPRKDSQTPALLDLSTFSKRPCRRRPGGEDYLPDGSARRRGGERCRPPVVANRPAGVRSSPCGRGRTLQCAQHAFGIAGDDRQIGARRLIGFEDAIKHQERMLGFADRLRADGIDRELVA